METEWERESWTKPLPVAVHSKPKDHFFNPPKRKNRDKGRSLTPEEIRVLLEERPEILDEGDCGGDLDTGPEEAGDDGFDDAESFMGDGDEDEAFDGFEDDQGFDDDDSDD